VILVQVQQSSISRLLQRLGEAAGVLASLTGGEAHILLANRVASPEGAQYLRLCCPEGTRGKRPSCSLLMHACSGLLSTDTRVVEAPAPESFCLQGFKPFLSGIWFTGFTWAEAACPKLHAVLVRRRDRYLPMCCGGLD